MSEDKINSRRNWKAETFPYDYFLPDNTKECQYCLTDNQAEILRGIIQPLGWLTRWWSDSDATIDRDTIESFRDDITRRLMMPCCNDDLIYTYDSDGNLQVSDDGGVVFTPDPQADIRVNPRVSFPPIPSTGDNPKCKSADGMVELIKEQVGDRLTDDMSRYTLEHLITDWTTTMIGTSNPFQALAVIVTNQIFALLISAVRAALTTGVYDTLRCIFDCHMDSTGFFSGSAWEAVRSDILSQISGVAGIFLEHLVYLIGNGGLSNLARAGAGSDSADCSECCPVCGNDWEAGQWQDGVLIPYNLISARGDGFIEMNAFLTGGTYVAIISSPSSDICCTITVTTMSGLIGGVSVIPCGTDHNYTNFVPGSAGPCNENKNSIKCASSMPFSVRFDFVEECPP